VEMVAELKARSPGICEPVLDAIGAVSLSAMRSMNDPVRLGELMNMNHALLEVLGVGHPQLSRLVLASRAAGAYGAKLTGAGGGGCMIAICPKHAKSRIAGALETCEARAFSTSIDTEGVRKEKDA
jgi:mevalonate kinase